MSEEKKSECNDKCACGLRERQRPSRHPPYATTTTHAPSPLGGFAGAYGAQARSGRHASRIAG